MNDSLVLLQETRLERGVIMARQAQELRRVPVFIPTLCRVRHGEKQLLQGQTVHQAGPDQLILMPAGEELHIRNLPGTHGYLAETVSLSHRLVQRFRERHGPVLETAPRPPDAHALCITPDGSALRAWDGLLSSIEHQEPAALREHHAEGLLLTLALSGHATLLLHDKRAPLCARIQSILLTDPAADWRVEQIATRLHIGASTLRRHLAQDGRHFRDILEDVRLGMALGWLQGGRRSIGEIARACGYASASRFAVRFRQRYGMSPSELRATL